MTVLSPTQDTSAKLDYTFDWSAQLAANGNATISTATVTASGGAVVSNLTPAATTVTFRLTTSAVTGTPTRINVVNHVVLSTGEEDERTMSVQVTDR